jgi:hypothetical protein
VCVCVCVCVMSRWEALEDFAASEGGHAPAFKLKMMASAFAVLHFIKSVSG